MNMPTVESILSRAMSEPEFAKQLFADADQALVGYDLTAEELAQIKSISQAQFDAMVLEGRKSFVSVARGSGFYQVRGEGG